MSGEENEKTVFVEITRKVPHKEYDETLGFNMTSDFKISPRILFYKSDRWKKQKNKMDKEFSETINKLIEERMKQNENET